MLALVPASGSAKIDGVDVAAMPRGELARRIAYLPQGQVLHWPLTVERLVGLGRLPHLAPMSRLTDADAAAIERAMDRAAVRTLRSEEHTSELQSLMRTSYAVFCLKKKMVTVCPSKIATRRTRYHVLVGCS